MPDLAQLVGSTQTREARFAPSTVNESARTVELTWTTGATVRRRTWLGERFDEELVIGPRNVRLGRLNSGANLLDSHNAFGIAGIIGVVQRAWLAGTEGRAVVRFSEREAVEPIWRDVRAGIIRNVSVGYDIHAVERVERKDSDVPLVRITDWEPLELSLVAVPADAGAQTRSGATAARTRTMDTEQNTTGAQAGAVDTPPAARANLPSGAPAAGGAADAALGERERSAAIRQAAKVLKIDAAVAGQLVADGVPLEQARDAMFRSAAARDEADAIVGNGHASVRGGFSAEDPEHQRNAMADALANRLSGGIYALTDQARQYRGVTVVDMLRDQLEARGVSARRLRPHEVVTRAYAPHTTSDFPLLLADSANKALQAAYMAAPAALKQIARETGARDFKDQYRLRVGSFPSLLEVGEVGEYTAGTVTEERETFKLAKFGRIFAVSFEALTNDDLNGFTDQVAMVANAVTSLEADKLTAVLADNPVMGDGTELFHGNHGNVGTGGAISVTTLGEGRQLMRSQKALDGTTVLNIAPASLVVPAALETVAEQALATIFATSADDAPVFAGRLAVVTEARLDAASVTEWYLAASPSQVPGLSYAYLDGMTGPTVETRLGFEVDAVQIKCRHIFAAFAQDWRGLVKNAGA